MNTCPYYSIEFLVAVAPAPPNRWLAIDDIGSAELEMEGVTFGGAQRTKPKFPFGTLDATWTGPNTLEVTSVNVKRFSVLLSPKMVDLKNPLHVLLNGDQAFDGPISSSLAYGLQYLDQHCDPGMIFVGEVALSNPKLQP